MWCRSSRSREVRPRPAEERQTAGWARRMHGRATRRFPGTRDETVPRKAVSSAENKWISRHSRNDDDDRERSGCEREISTCNVESEQHRANVCLVSWLIGRLHPTNIEDRARIIIAQIDRIEEQESRACAEIVDVWRTRPASTTQLKSK